MNDFDSRARESRAFSHVTRSIGRGRDEDAANRTKTEGTRDDADGMGLTADQSGNDSAARATRLANAFDAVIRKSTWARRCGVRNAR